MEPLEFKAENTWWKYICKIAINFWVGTVKCQSPILSAQCLDLRVMRTWDMMKIGKLILTVSGRDYWKKITKDDLDVAIMITRSCLRISNISLWLHLCLKISHVSLLWRQTAFLLASKIHVFILEKLIMILVWNSINNVIMPFSSLFICYIYFYSFHSVLKRLTR